MRILTTIPHSKMRISVFGMNNKYILKLEFGPLEQAFKWDEYDFANLEDFTQIVAKSSILENSLKRFEEMMTELSLN